MRSLSLSTIFEEHLPLAGESPILKLISYAVVRWYPMISHDILYRFCTIFTNALDHFCWGHCLTATEASHLFWGGMGNRCGCKQYIRSISRRDTATKEKMFRNQAENVPTCMKTDAPNKNGCHWDVGSWVVHSSRMPLRLKLISTPRDWFVSAVSPSAWRKRSCPMAVCTSLTMRPVGVLDMVHLDDLGPIRPMHCGFEIDYHLLKIFFPAIKTCINM